MDHAERDPLARLSLLPVPVKPRSDSRRTLQAWSRRCQAVLLANDAILGLQQLNAGRLDDRLLQRTQADPELRGDAIGMAAAERLALICEHRLPPVDRPQADAALQRLLGERAGRPAFPRQHADSFKQATERLLSRQRKEDLPRRGDQFPAHWAAVALPPPGTVPVNILDVSPRCAAYLHDIVGKMIHPDRSQAMSDSGVVPYMDPHFREPSNLLALAKRMAAGGMLRAVPQALGVMPIFTVAKKASMTKDSVDVSLRLIFDLRLENEGWRNAPWCGLGGVSSLSYLDVSEELQDGFELLFAVGDIPDYFYMLEIPEELSQYFTLEGLCAQDLRSALDPGVELPGEGDFIACRVLPMGYKWSVFIAQTVLEDVFEAGGEDVPGLNIERRVMEGAALPQITRDDPVVHYNYIDDYGIIGIGRAGDHGADHPVQRARCAARELLRGCGFGVHKEACSTRERMIGGDFDGTEVLPNQDKVWLLIDGTKALCKKRRGRASLIESILGSFTWFFLLSRTALSVFNEIYPWCQRHRECTREMNIPDEILRELACAAAIAPLVHADLAAKWYPETYMYDASMHGGAVIATTATVAEQRAEARWATRAGWCVWAGGCEVDIEVEEGIVIGDRVRAPAVGEGWDDICRWHELFRWTWKFPEHINLLEMRTGLAALRRAARDPGSWGKRVLLIGDSLVTLGAFSKGRSSSAPVLHLCRRVAALSLGFSIRCYWRWIQTDRNHSDGPSRGGPLGIMAKNISEAFVRLPGVWLESAAILGSVKVPIAIYRFIHAFSGHRRLGDIEDFLTQLFADAGAVVFVENVDIGFGPLGDLTQQSVVDRLVTMIESRTIDAGHFGPPCSSWSRVRFKKPGPPPLRNRDWLWGLPPGDLSAKNREKVRLANVLLMACLILIEALQEISASWSLEHPADPGRWPFPSIWVLDRVLRLTAAGGVEKVTFPQRMLGCPAQKMTTLLGVVDNLNTFDKPCVHRRHAEELAGLDENGRWRTRIAQAYPAPMCELLARCHARRMLSRGPVGGSTTISESALRQARDQQDRDRSELRIQHIEELPPGFLAASG